MPANGYVAVRGLRIFGNSTDAYPKEVTQCNLKRMKDEHYAEISWKAAKGAEGYVVRYGPTPDKLYLSVDVMDTTALPNEIPLWPYYHVVRKKSFLDLTIGQDYYFSFDSFNERGITRGKKIYYLPSQLK